MTLSTRRFPLSFSPIIISLSAVADTSTGRATICQMHLIRRHSCMMMTPIPVSLTNFQTAGVGHTESSRQKSQSPTCLPVSNFAYFRILSSMFFTIVSQRTICLLSVSNFYTIRNRKWLIKFVFGFRLIIWITVGIPGIK